MKALRRAALLSLLVALATLGLVPGAAASPPPGGGSSQCSVYQYIYPGSTVKMEQHVYHCDNEAFVAMDLYFQRSGTTVKEIHKTLVECRSSKHTLGNCVRDWEYSFSNPAGLQTWTVCAVVQWTSPFGPISKFKNCYSRKL